MKVKIIITLIVGLFFYMLVDNIKLGSKYDFTVTASAPRFYPSEIVKGDFYLSDGSSVYIPSGSIMNTGWGGMGATHIVGPELKALPIGFSVIWLSFVERKFYKGTFTLDKVLIEQYFQMEYRDGENKKQKFHEFKISVAPKGVVVLWVHGIGRQIEIGRYQAKEVEISKKDFIPNAVISIDQYIDLVLKEDLPKEHQNSDFIDNIPFGLWDIYRKKYIWRPRVEFSNKKNQLGLIDIDYYNAERISTQVGTSELIAYDKRAIPKYISLYWIDIEGDTSRVNITLGNMYGSTEQAYVEMEKEILGAFKTLDASKGVKIDFIIAIDVIEEKNKSWVEVKIFLDNGMKKIQLKKIRY